ncbi:MAG: TIGR03084 family protein [bacterium]|nr:TIGR03084 family protein [bacterium]
MTMRVSIDFRDEARDLYAFLETLEVEDWTTPTLFKGWTPWDVVAHLHYFDEVSLHAADGEEAFTARRKEFLTSTGGGMTIKEVHCRGLGHCDAPELLERWKATADALSSKLGSLDPKARLPWFGPDMGAKMFTTARYMEAWSHAQAIYDLKRVTREHRDRIRNIVTIGLRTFGWTFVNRGQEIPGPPPYLRLTSPSGELWEYNAPSDVERIEGNALDFCLTVTQVRNVEDTALSVRGDLSKRWMEIAQCFAGPPNDPPEPGVRIGA